MNDDILVRTYLHLRAILAAVNRAPKGEGVRSEPEAQNHPSSVVGRYGRHVVGSCQPSYGQEQSAILADAT